MSDAQPIWDLRYYSANELRDMLASLDASWAMIEPVIEAVEDSRRFERAIAHMRNDIGEIRAGVEASLRDRENGLLMRTKENQP